MNIGSTSVKQNAYKSLVRPLVEYASTVWDPYTQQDVHRLEMVQRRAARYVSNRLNNRSSVNDMIEHLDWQSLEHRRRTSRLTMMHKIVNDRVAINKQHRLIPPQRRTRHTHQLAFQIPSSSCDYRKYSFFPRTIREWNTLPPGIVSAGTPESFKTQVSAHQF